MSRHTPAPHWQQSFGPGVGVTVGVLVTVTVGVTVGLLVGVTVGPTQISPEQFSEQQSEFCVQAKPEAIHWASPFAGNMTKIRNKNRATRFTRKPHAPRPLQPYRG